MSVRGLDKLRNLFAQEAESRLSTLGQLVLELERSDANELAGVIAEVFREVHTLKGSAAVVGFEDVAQYAHGVEEKLALLRSGSVVPTPTIIDALLLGVDRLGSMIWESVAGDAVDAPANAAALGRLDEAFNLTSVPADLVADLEHGDQPDPADVSVPDSVVVRTDSGMRAVREGEGTIMVPVERLDKLVRMVGEAAAAHLRVGRVLAERVGIEAANIAEFSELSRLLVSLQEATMQTRMVPVSTVTDQLQRAVRDAARAVDKDVRWEVRGDDTEMDRSVLHQLADSLLHLVRNAVDHGIDSPAQRAERSKPAQAFVRLHAMQLGSEVVIAVSDDGGGIDIERVREQGVRAGIDVEHLSDEDAMQLIFRSGFSTSKFVTDISGRGVGLDVVRSSVEAARGRVEIRSTPGVGSEFRIIVPVTLAVLRCVLVEVAGQRYALPSHRVALVQSAQNTTLFHAEGRQVLRLNDLPVPISNLADVLGVAASERSSSGMFVIINGPSGQHALLVDGLVGQRDVVVKAFGGLVARLEVLAGASIEPDGSILLVLDAAGLVERSRRTAGFTAADVGAASIPEPRVGRLLIVDDALTVRELQRTILERAGFEVTLAVDGVDALEHLENEAFDLVLTDVEMPRMNGFELTERIRAHPAFSNVAVLILTSLASEADRLRGMNVGADGYIVKSSFDETSLLAAVDRLVGIPA